MVYARKDARRTYSYLAGFDPSYRCSSAAEARGFVSVRRYRDYDPFAWLYANYWGHEFHSQAMAVLDRLLLARLPRKAAVLDLCCGDGRVTSQLARRGFRVTGLDGSERMLTYARQRTRRAGFLLADARSFQLPPRFDAAISTFDSLNHVLDPGELEAVFHNVFACLKPGASFAFDLNREQAYRELWARTSTGVERDTVSIARGAYDGLTRFATCDVTLFRLEDKRWLRSDFRLTQKFHPQAEVVDRLARAGFAVKIFDASRDLDMQGDIGQGRTFFLGTKR